MTTQTTSAQSTHPALDGWWRNAACADSDPAWWCDDEAMRAIAVQICLECPVRAVCLAEALQLRDEEVIRGAMLVRQNGRGPQLVNLVCTKCNSRPLADFSNRRSQRCVGCQEDDAFRRQRYSRARARRLSEPKGVQ